MQIITTTFSAIFESIRACAFCGSYLEIFKSYPNTQNSSPQFCEVCWLKIMMKKVAHLIGDYPHPVCSLFRWDHQYEELIRSLVVGLKGGGPEQLFEFYALLLAEQRTQFSVTLKSTEVKRVFIPAPSASSKPDHSEQLATHIARICGGEYWPVLERTNQKKQKLKTEKERRVSDEKRLQVKPNQQQRLKDLKNSPRSAYSVVFVDDIITSGATAHAAFQALEEPHDFEVWTLAHRPKFNER